MPDVAAAPLPLALFKSLTSVQLVPLKLSVLALLPGPEPAKPKAAV